MKRVIMLLLAVLFAVSVHASELEIINLKHRTAEELIPVIRPLLDKDEMVSGMNYQLILRASPHNITQIKRLLDGLDTMPRRLKITVMQNVDSDTASRLLALSGSVGGHISLGQQGSARIISTRSLEDDKKTQQLQVLEGNRALVRSGQSVPVPQRQLVQTPWGTQMTETTQYREVASGFYVLPRIQGDRVTLEISTQNDALAPNQNTANVTRIQNTNSTVSGRLGEWISLGGVEQQHSTDDSTITSRSTSRLNEARTVLIKVEEVD
jgi:type II secretory pathway component GspD/PulD (secretin)